MYGNVSDGEPFAVSVRRESVGGGLMIRFECKEGMGVLGIRKSGRSDPAPVAAYEEEEIDPASLRAGRFVHVLPSGQRQSYALSRVSAELAARVPIDRWLTLKPQTEYGFRYLVVAESDLDGTTASVAVGSPTPEPRSRATDPRTGPVDEPRSPTPGPVTGPVPHPPSLHRTVEPSAERTGRGGERITPLPTPDALPPPQTPMAPAIAEAALKLLSKEQSIELLKTEMHKVHRLQQRVSDLEDALQRSKQHERDLIELLSRWNLA
ncbi:MAG: hypothetical protein ABMA64_10075 [Myxococcota bacterium]